MHIAIQHYLLLAMILFSIGAIGLAIRRDLAIVIISSTVMTTSAMIPILAFARWNLLPEGNSMAIFIIAIMASELLLGISIIRRSKSEGRC